jgi:hypothetical protein
MNICSWEGASIEASLTVSVMRGTSGRPLALYWLINVPGEQHVV